MNIPEKAKSHLDRAESICHRIESLADKEQFEPIPIRSQIIKELAYDIRTQLLYAKRAMTEEQ